MSISRKNKRWYVQIDVPAGPDGKRRRRGVGGFKTKREAKAAEAEALRRLKEQTFVEPSRVLVREYLTTWLAGMANQVRPTTLDGYRHQVRAYLLPHLGDVRLQQLTTARLNQLYAELAERGGKDGQPLASKTVRLAHTVIRRALWDAMADGLVARNVAAQARPPEPARSRCTLGRPRRSAPSWPRSASTGCMRPGCCWPPSACVGASCWGCAGRTWT